MKSAVFFRRICVTALALSALTFLASPVLAETVTIFGPKVYNKDKGAPATYKDYFSSPPGTNNFRLIVTNGTDNAGEVKNVSISLNGVEVVSSSDLRSNGVAQKQISFQLLPTNTLDVTLKGQGGNAIVVQFIADQLASEPPTDTPPYIRK